MTVRNPSGYLPHMTGPIDFQVDGTDASVERRGTINLVGLSVEDDPDNDRTNVTVAASAAVAVSALEIDWAASGVHTKTLAAGANTFTFANAASGMVIVVRVTGAASTVTWPTVKWAGGSTPTQTASGTDVYTFVHDGTSIYGSVVQDMS